MGMIYGLIVIVALALIFPYLDWIMRGVIFIVLVVYLVFFSGFSGLIRPFFDDMSGWAVKDVNRSYSFRGTGVAISPNLLLTNYHVIDGCAALKVRTIDNKVYDVALKHSLKRETVPFLGGVAKDGHDVSLLQSMQPLAQYAILSDKMPVEGDRLISPDYDSEPGHFDVRKGKMLSHDTEKHRIRFSGMGRKGNSGSPVYNDKGYLVAIQWGGGGDFLSKQDNVAASWYVVKSWLEHLRVPLYKVASYDESIIETEWFKKSFAVGILCYQDDGLS